MVLQPSAENCYTRELRVLLAACPSPQVTSFTAVVGLSFTVYFGKTHCFLYFDNSCT